MSKITRRRFVKGAAIAPLAVKHLAMQQAAGTSDRFDIVVAGAGHNSLITAAYLAKAGYRCVVLEGRPKIGGGVKTAELTLKGFNDDCCSTAHVFIQDNPLIKNNELNLREYGLEYIDPDPIFHVPFADATYLTQWRDLDRTCAEFAKFSRKDAAAYRKMLAELDAVRSILVGGAFSPIGFAKPLNDQLAQVPHGKLWQRRLAMSAWDIIQDTFEDDHCRTFMLYMSHLAAEPPDAPVTGRLAYGAPRQQHSGRPLPKGGSGALTQALGQFIEAQPGHRKWQMRWRGVQRWQFLSRLESRGLYHSHQASCGYGAEGIVGRGFCLWRRNMASGKCHVRDALRYQRAADVQSRWRNSFAGGVGNSGVSLPRAAFRLRRCLRRRQSGAAAAADNLLQRCGRDTRAGGHAHAEGARLAALSTKRRSGTLGQDQV